LNDYDSQFSNDEIISRKSAQSSLIANSFEWAEALITSLIAVVILFTFLFRVVNVSGPSMLPNLQSNDRVVLSSYFYKSHRGDVVVIANYKARNCT